MKRWPFYPLQSPEGDPPPTGGDPPKDPPPKGAPPPPEPKTIPIDVLPKELRDKPAAEVQFLLGHMITALGERNNEVDALKDQVAELRGAISASPKPDPKPDPHAGKTMEELILEDTEGALDRWAESRGYGRVVDGLTSEIGETMFAVLGTQIDDLEEHEEDIRKILKAGNLAPTKRNILGAYTMTVGQKTLEAKQRGGRKGTGGVPPTPAGDPPPTPAEPVLSELEKEVMRAHGITDTKVWADMRDNPPQLKLRTS
jgi:hypothetical protein